jgi:hypothetical protein
VIELDDGVVEAPAGRGDRTEHPVEADGGEAVA